VRTLKTFQGTHILGASRGLLCDSYAVLYIYTPVKAFGTSVDWQIRSVTLLGSTAEGNWHTLNLQKCNIIIRETETDRGFALNDRFVIAQYRGSFTYLCLWRTKQSRYAMPSVTKIKEAQFHTFTV